MEISAKIKAEFSFIIAMDYLPTEKRGKVVGSSNFVNNITGAVAQLVGGILYAASPQLPFLVAPPIIVAGFVITTLLIKEPKHRQQ